jgi:peptidoglycan/xylan/chitin deacetylase (PgdA/CDA1 family)
MDAAKWAGGVVAATLGGMRPARVPGGLGILLYHRVTPGTPGRPTLYVTPRRFREQLEGLLARGYRFARLRDVLAAAAAGEPVDARTAVVTFDDGYASVHRHAMPVLRDLGVPATVFVVTAYVGSADPFPFDRWARGAGGAAAEASRPLTWDECEELEASGVVEIGSHTHTHADFRGRPDALHDDVARSLDVLGDRLGGGPWPFAFPFGDVDSGFATPELGAAVRRAGATCALTTAIRVVRPGDDPFAWGRLEASGSDGPAALYGKLAGWYEGMGPARRRVQRLV